MMQKTSIKEYTRLIQQIKDSNVVFSGEFKYLEGLNQRIKEIIRDVGDILAELPRSILVYNELQIRLMLLPI